MFIKILESKGAFTAAVSAQMLSSCECDYVLVGHSERRAIFGETNSDINRNLKQVISNGMKAVLCIGETKEEYELGLNAAICAVQLSNGLAGLTPKQVSEVVIAYEPVWAIGTGYFDRYLFIITIVIISIASFYL